MQQHPVPQNISSYEFRLVGDMTLKQFLQLLGGAFVGFLFFITNLPSIIKWFFIIVSVIMGAAFAFLPLEGRSLDKWLLAYIRSIYKPTQFHWKKTPKLPDYLSDKPVQKTSAKPKLKSKAISKDKKPNHEDKLNQQESGRINKINQLFSSEKPTKPKPPTTPKPQPTSKPQPQNPPPQPKPTPAVQQKPSPQIKTKPEIQIKPATQPKTPQADPKKTNKQPEPIQGTIVPEKLNQDGFVKAKLNPDLPFPSLPETKNTLVGMVFTKDKKIVDNAIIEIQNQSQHTVRATKTNKIGQFFLATPLDSGSYLIKTEKEGLDFDTISIQLEDKIYPPIEIVAK